MAPLELVALVLSVVSVLIGVAAIWKASRSANEAEGMLESLLFLLNSGEPEAETKRQPKDRVRSAVLEYLEDRQSSTVGDVSRTDAPELAGTRLQRFEVLAELVGEGVVVADGPLRMSTPVRLRQT